MYCAMNNISLSIGGYYKSSESRKEDPQKLTRLSSRSHPRHLVGKRTAQKDTIIDITSDIIVYIRWKAKTVQRNEYRRLDMIIIVSFCAVLFSHEVSWMRS